MTRRNRHWGDEVAKLFSHTDFDRVRYPLTPLKNYDNFIDILGNVLNGMVDTEEKLALSDLLAEIYAKDEDGNTMITLEQLTDYKMRLHREMNAQLENYFNQAEDIADHLISVPGDSVTETITRRQAGLYILEEIRQPYMHFHSVQLPSMDTLYKTIFKK